MVLFSIYQPFGGCRIDQVSFVLSRWMVYRLIDSVSLPSTPSTGAITDTQPNRRRGERQPVSKARFNTPPPPELRWLGSPAHLKVSVKLEDVETILSVDDGDSTNQPQMALEPPSIPTVRQPFFACTSTYAFFRHMNQLTHGHTSHRWAIKMKTVPELPFHSHRRTSLETSSSRVKRHT